MADGETAAAAAEEAPPQGPQNSVADRAMRALQAARAAAVRCPTGVWPRLDHDGATCGYEERPAAPLSRAEAAEADAAAADWERAQAGAAAAAAAAAAPSGAAPPPPLLKPVQQLRAAVAVMLRTLEPAAAAPEEGPRAKQHQHQHQHQREAAAAAKAARALHAADALSFARRLAAYATPWARDAGERLALGLQCAAAREDLLAGHMEERKGARREEGGAAPAAAGGAAAAPPPSAARAGPLAMVGGALVSRAPFGTELFQRAVVSACMALDGCSGDDFARFCGARPYEGGGDGGGKDEAPPIGAASTATAAASWAPCPLARVHARLFLTPQPSSSGAGGAAETTASAAEEREACRDAFLLCLGRARRAGAAAARRGGGAGGRAVAGWLGPPPPPPGVAFVPSEGFWASLPDLARLEAALVRAPAAAPPKAPSPSAPRQQQPPPNGEGDARPPPSALDAARRAWARRPLRDPLPSQTAAPPPPASASSSPAAPKAAAAAKAAAAPPPAPPPPARLSWQQTSADVEIRLALPAGTRARDVRVEVGAGKLAVWVSWQPGQAVIEGELWRRVKAGDAVWTVASGGGGSGGGGSGGGGTGGGGGGCEWCELQLLLPKDESRRYWKGLFAGEEERGHLQLLREAVQADETRADAAALDAAAAAGSGGGGGEEENEGGGRGGGGAAELLRQLRERQALVASGELDLRHGFDDFRLVLSDDGL